MTPDELQKRVSAALDAPGGVDSDAELKALVEKDPELQRFVADAIRLNELLFDWPLEELPESKWEAMAERVMQRLDDSLAPVGDVTRAPAFDDEDARRDPSGATKAQEPAQAAGFSIERLSDLESTEELDIPHLPPPVPAEKSSNVVPLTSIKPGSVARKNERFEIPMIAPALRPLQPMVDLAPAPRKSRTGWIALSGVLAAAAALLIVFGTDIFGSRDGVETVAMTDTTAPDVAPPSAPGGGMAFEQGVRAESARFANDEAPNRSAPTTPSGVAPAPVQEQPRLETALGAATGSERVVTEEGRANSQFAMGDTAGADDNDALGRRGRAAGGGGFDRGAGDLDVMDGLSTGGVRGAGEASPDPGTRGDLAAARDTRARPPSASPTSPAMRSAEQPSANTGPPLESPPAPPPRASATTTAASPARDDSEMPEQPSQAEVRAALESVRAAILACADGRHGIANVRVTFTGRSGRATTAIVEGIFAGTPQGSCMARAARAATVSRFSEPSLNVTYPYSL